MEMSQSEGKEDKGRNEPTAYDEADIDDACDRKFSRDAQTASANKDVDPEHDEEGCDEPTASASDEAVFYDTSDRNLLHDAQAVAADNDTDAEDAPTSLISNGIENNDPDPDVSLPAADASHLAVAAAGTHKIEKKIPPISPIVKVSPIVKCTATTRPVMRFPPPFPDLIHGYHHNDVLSGRGATINAHPGNKRFRSMCADHKSEFESAPNCQKRKIAFEIVESVLNWNPSGRFIERVDDNANNCSAESLKKNKKLKRELGPWKDIGIEGAIQKAMSVIRDYKRADRIALRAMGMLKRKRKQNHSYLPCLPSSIGGMDDEAPTQDINADTSQDDDISVYKEILPTPNDVLLGRGAFINEHVGNRNLRSLALEHKSQFDAAAPAVRRIISYEIFTLIKALNPPGRFLKRATYALQDPVLLPDGKYQLPPRGLEGPWEEISDIKACAKAMQVMRDMKAKVPKSNETSFREAAQVAALTSVNASMKDFMDTEAEQQAVDFRRVNASVADSME